jgi:hypothetical protein
MPDKGLLTASAIESGEAVTEVKTFTTVLPAVAAGTAVEYPIFVAPHACYIKKIYFIPSATITGASDTNYSTFGVVNKLLVGVGTDFLGTALIYNLTLAKVATAFSGTDADGVLYEPTIPLEVPAGTVLNFSKAYDGTGLAWPISTVVVQWISKLSAAKI